MRSPLRPGPASGETLAELRRIGAAETRRMMAVSGRRARFAMAGLGA
jgi:hypothetical protein